MRSIFVEGLSVGKKSGNFLFRLSMESTIMQSILNKRNISHVVVHHKRKKIHHHYQSGVLFISDNAGVKTEKREQIYNHAGFFKGETTAFTCK